MSTVAFETRGRGLPSLAATELARDTPDLALIRRRAAIGGATSMLVMMLAGALSPTRMMPKAVIVGCCVAGAFRARHARAFASAVIASLAGFFGTFVVWDAARHSLHWLVTLVR